MQQLIVFLLLLIGLRVYSGNVFVAGPIALALGVQAIRFTIGFCIGFRLGYREARS